MKTWRHFFFTKTKLPSYQRSEKFFHIASRPPDSGGPGQSCQWLQCRGCTACCLYRFFSAPPTQQDWHCPAGAQRGPAPVETMEVKRTTGSLGGGLSLENTHTHTIIHTHTYTITHTNEDVRHRCSCAKHLKDHLFQTGFRELTYNLHIVLY